MFNKLTLLIPPGHVPLMVSKELELVLRLTQRPPSPADPTEPKKFCVLVRVTEPNPPDCKAYSIT